MILFGKRFYARQAKMKRRRKQPLWQKLKSAGGLSRDQKSPLIWNSLAVHQTPNA